MRSTRIIALALGMLAAAFFVTQAHAAGFGGGAEGATRDASSTNVALLIFFFCLSVGVSFLCSIAEAVLLSITPSFVGNLQQRSPKVGGVLADLKDNIDRPLAAILTLNTIAHTIGAGGVGAMSAKVFPATAAFWFMAFYTAILLFGSEIIPKTIGAVYWRKLAPITGRLLKGLILLLYPLIILTEQLSRFISGGKKKSAFSREEFSAMADIGEKEGKLRAQESTVFKNMLSMQDLKSKDIMTPRTVMVALQQDEEVDKVLEQLAKIPFSRIPVFGTDRDDIQGFVLKSDLLLAHARDQHATPLRECVKAIEAVPESMPLTTLLDYFLNKRAHLALVVNEYGGTAGLVTLEDVVETILGMEIIDEADRDIDMQALARAQWQKRAKGMNLVLPEDESAPPTTPPDA